MPSHRRRLSQREGGGATRDGTREDRLKCRSSKSHEPDICLGGDSAGKRDISRSPRKAAFLTPPSFSVSSSFIHIKKKKNDVTRKHSSCHRGKLKIKEEKNTGIEKRSDDWNFKEELTSKKCTEHRYIKGKSERQFSSYSVLFF